MTAGDCRACHETVYTDWQKSHHAKAMQHASDDTVLARFDKTPTAYQGNVFRFYREGGDYWVSIEKSDNQRADSTLIYAIPYTFGYEPLQQYLAALPGGKLQALPVAWDTRPAAEGGQRWYALESDLAWDHPGFTWNTSCADCHSTGLQKNYDADSGGFSTQWDEINVACAACHGDSAGHADWLQAGKPDHSTNAGFPVSLAERGEWRWLEGSAIAQARQQPGGEQLSTCGRCHSRRDRVGEWHPGMNVTDHTALAATNPPLYYADGQIRDEVFVLGSFMQSRMHSAGVVCSHCHEPHSAQLRAQGDALCGQCHQAQVFSVSSHHGHEPEQLVCVDCHMPATVYMGVDARRDHRFGIPDPVLSGQLNSPDPCADCHRDQTAEALAEQIASFRADGAQASPSVGLTRMFAGFEGGMPTASQRFKLDGEAFSPIRQAALLQRLDVATDDNLLAIAAGKLGHSSPLVRSAAVRALANVPLEARWRILAPHLGESVAVVRLELAAVLASAASLAARDGKSAALMQLFVDYERYMAGELDSPTLVANFANYRAARGQIAEARRLYRHALALDAQFTYPYLQLAELAREGGTSVRSEREWLDAALEVAPQDAELHYRFGLYWVRAKHYMNALAALARAYDLQPSFEGYATTYAIALESTGDAEAAIDLLATYLAENPFATPVADLLLRYATKYGKSDLAAEVLANWRGREPDNPQMLRWQRYLQ